jgi:hypothetical protein
MQVQLKYSTVPKLMHLTLKLRVTQMMLNMYSTFLYSNNTYLGVSVP